MDLRDYALVLRKRWRLVLAFVLVAFGGAAALTLVMTPMYQAKTQLFVSANDNTSMASVAQGGQFTQQRVTSYADIVASPAVTQPVIQQLGLTMTPDQLAKKISASAPLNTVLINVAVTDASAAQAARLANAVSAQFTEVVNGLEKPADGGPSPVKVTVVRSASVPTEPVSPRKKLNLALGFLVGLALGIGAAVLRETLDTTIKTPEQLQAESDVPTLGVISYDPGARDRPLIVHTDPQSTRAEAFRQVRTNLQFVQVDRSLKSIVVTSALPEEGKTTACVNLAITMAQAGMRVLLIEADLRRPQTSNYLGLEGAVGLTNVLIGQAHLDDVTQVWGNQLMHVLPAGPTPPNPSELLGSQQMADLLAHCSDRYDIVLLDAPPLLPVTDAAVLSAIASGAVVIVHHGYTKRDQLGRALDALRVVDARVLGTVLNFAPGRGPDAYRYGYSYRYAASHPRLPSPRSQSAPLHPVELQTVAVDTASNGGRGNILPRSTAR